MRYAAILILAGLSWAQAPGTGSIAGTVSGPQGSLERVNVRARSLATDDSFQTMTLADGTYSLVLPAGSYDVFLDKATWTMFTHRSVVVIAGGKVSIDARMNPVNANVGVPGEFAFLLMGDDLLVADGPVPRLPDGRPDLSGVWTPSPSLYADDPVMLPWAAAVQKDHLENFGKDDPRAHCLPSGVVRTNELDLTKFLHMPSLLVILIEGSPPGFRQIFLDGRNHPAELEPTWMGHSVGQWDGDVLVVDTVGFHDKGWIGAGRPQTERLHVIERMRRVSLGKLEIEITVDDPGAYERPWKLRRILKLAAGEELREYVCNENEKPEHLVGK